MRDEGPHPGVLAQLRAEPQSAATPEWVVERAVIIEAMSRYAACVDARDWSAHRKLFEDECFVDLSSVNGKPASRIRADVFIQGVAQAFQRFRTTQHLLTNHLLAFDSEPAGESLGAHCVCDVLARHVKTDGALYDVGARYTVHFVRRSCSGPWRIDRLGLELLWSIGNRELGT